jgi:hypothetical protein
MRANETGVGIAFVMLEELEIMLESPQNARSLGNSVFRVSTSELPYQYGFSRIIKWHLWRKT